MPGTTVVNPASGSNMSGLLPPGYEGMQGTTNHSSCVFTTTPRLTLFFTTGVQYAQSSRPNNWQYKVRHYDHHFSSPFTKSNYNFCSNSLMLDNTHLVLPQYTPNLMDLVLTWAKVDRQTINNNCKS